MVFSILLIRPYSLTGRTFSRVTGVMAPLNLAYIASYLDNHLNKGEKRVDISIWDLELEPLHKTELIENLKKNQPDLIGITALTNHILLVRALTRIIKKTLPDVKIILGGPHASVEPKTTLEFLNDVDFIACGEGEDITLELTQLLMEKKTHFKDIKGISYREQDLIYFTGKRDLIEDVSKIGPPARNLLNYTKYLKFPQSPGIWKKTVNIFTQRGCIYACSFCASPIIHGKRVRFFELDKIFSEIENIREKYDVKHINFRDSNFTLNRKRIIKFCKELIKKDWDMTWNCETRVNLVDKTLLKLMYASGCRKISFGVESGSPRILLHIEKGIRIEDTIKAFKLCKEIGIQTQAYIMLGFPTETLEEIKLTSNLLKKIKPDFLQSALVVPIPGTRVFEEFKEHDLLINPRNYASYQFFHLKPAWKTIKLSQDDLLKVQRRILINFHLNLGYFVRTLSRIRNIYQLTYYLNAALDFALFLFKRK